MTRQPHWRWALCWTLGVVAVPSFAANSDQLTVTVQSPPQVSTEHGYVPYHVVVQNRSDQPHAVSLRLPSQVHSARSNTLYEIRRDVAVGPQSKIEVQLWQPAIQLNGHGLTVFVDGKRRANPVALSIAGHGRNIWHGRNKTLFVLQGQRVTSQLKDTMDRIWPPKPTGSPSPTKPRVELVRAELPTNQWSAHWLGFSAYDGVILTHSEFNAMPQKVQTALHRYVEVGGILLILGSAALPASWDPPRPTLDDPFEIYDLGFGQVLINAASNFQHWPKTTWSDVQNRFQKTAHPFAKRKDIETANQDWPVANHTQVPARSLLLMTLAFALAIGPVNLLILNRTQRKIWMLWTVPLISILTSAGIFINAIAKEGWTGVVRTVSLTHLDQRTRHATTLGYTAFYSPLTPRHGLMFDRHTELTPQILPRHNAGTARWLDWTNGQHLATGWINARVPAHFQIRKAQTRQERLNLIRIDQGIPMVVNGLGVDIESLMVADHDGQIYTAQQVKAGAKVTLQAVQDGRRVGDRPKQPLRELYDKRWEDEIPSLATNAHLTLVQGSYLATTSSCLFLEPGLQPYGSWQQEAVIYGIFRPQEGPHAH